MPALTIGLVFDDSLDRPDGVQQYVLELGRWLTAQDHRVYYLVGQTERTDLPDLHSLSRNVRVTYNGNRLTVPRPADKAKIKRLMSEADFDVLHVMMPYSPMLARRVIMAAPRSTVIIGTFHILPQTRLVRWSTGLLGGWLWRSLRRFDQVFAVSSSARDFAERSFRLRDVGILPNVLETSRFHDAKPFGGYKGTPTVMFLGRLVPRKGCQTLLAAIAELRKQYDGPLRLLICGKGPLEASLRKQAARLGIADLTEFTGFVSEADKPRYLASADVAVFPSTGGESFGIVLVEAMASGRPVVLAASNPGYATVMEERPEQMFRPGAALQLAQKLNRYLLDDRARRDAVDWQRQHVAQFDTAAVGQRLEQAYTAQLQKKQPA